MTQKQQPKATLTTHDRTRLVSELTALLEAKGLDAGEVTATLLLAFQVNAGWYTNSFLSNYGLKD